MVQEHERALGGWQAEWEALPDLARLTAGALANVKGEDTVSYGLLSAAAIMAIVPVFVFYLFTKNFLMSGMSSGAVKG